MILVPIGVLDHELLEPPSVLDLVRAAPRIEPDAEDDEAVPAHMLIGAMVPDATAMPDDLQRMRADDA
jgi:hypothetical protein